MGWIRLDRKLLDEPYYLDGKFDRTRAWIDLLLLASTKKAQVYKQGRVINVQRGEIAMSEVELSTRWHLNRRTVRKYLDEMQADGRIDIRKSHVVTIVTIAKYADYQDVQKMHNRVHNRKTTDNQDDKTDIRQPSAQPTAQLNPHFDAQPAAQPNATDLQDVTTNEQQPSAQPNAQPSAQQYITSKQESIYLSPSNARTREAMFIDELRTAPIWRENVMRMARIDEGTLNKRLDEFQAWCLARGKEQHRDLSDVKDHFARWLTQRQQTEQRQQEQQKRYGNNKPQTMAERNADTLNAAAEAMHKLRTEPKVDVSEFF